MYAACIISDVILEKSKNRGATNIFALLKQMINSKPYHSCLPNPLNLSSLSSLVLWSACNNRPVSRSGSSSDPLNSPAAALPSWLASLAEPTTLSLPVSLLCHTVGSAPFTLPYLFKVLTELSGHPYANFSSVSMLSTLCPCTQGSILFITKALQTLI